MNISLVTDIFAALVVVAGISVLVRNGTGTAKIITAWGEAFSASVRAATGS